MPTVRILTIQPSRADPAPQNEDIAEAFPVERSWAAHLEMITKSAWPSAPGRHLANNSPRQEFYERTYQYKFEQLSATRVRRTGTIVEEFDMDVQLYLARRLAHPNHRIFGSPGAAIWYGGRTTLDLTRLGAIWDSLESVRPERRVDHEEWPFTPAELRHFLILPVSGLDQAKRAELEAPTLVEFRSLGPQDKSRFNEGRDKRHSPDDIIKVRHRENRIPWRTVISAVGVSEADVLDRTRTVDVRSATPLIADTIREVKPTYVSS